MIFFVNLETIITDRQLYTYSKKKFDNLETIVTHRIVNYYI